MTEQQTLVLYEDESADPGAAQEFAARCGGAAERFTREDGAGNLVLAPAPAAPSGGHGIVNRCRLGDASDPAITHLFKVDIRTPPEDGQELIAWYDEEHLPILLECDTWVAGGLFERREGRDGRQFHALHWLSDPAALDSDARARSRATPWFNRLKQRPWFDGAFVRKLYRKT